MRHLKSRKKLGLATGHRTAMVRNMVTSLMIHGRIRTTLVRAKEVRRVADRIITLSKRVPHASLGSLQGDALIEARARRVHAIRQARLWIDDRDVLEVVFSEYSDRYAQRPGGYTRVLKLGRRPGDQADMALLELVTEAYPPVATES